MSQRCVAGAGSLLAPPGPERRGGGVCSLSPSVHLERDEWAVEPDAGDEAGFRHCPAGSIAR
eukprot:gene9195-70_t